MSGPMGFTQGAGQPHARAEGCGHLYLVVKVTPGTSIEDAVTEAIDVSRRTGIGTRFMFLGVEVSVWPLAEKFDVIHAWRQAYGAKGSVTA